MRLARLRRGGERGRYTGGVKPNPTYAAIKDHTESVRIEFDPRAVSYRQLLDMFWFVRAPPRAAHRGRDHHNPTYMCSNQYKSAVWYQTEQQRAVFQESLHWQRTEGPYRTRRIHTILQALGPWYLAEQYHQVAPPRRLPISPRRRSISRTRRWNSSSSATDVMSRAQTALRRPAADGAGRAAARFRTLRPAARRRASHCLLCAIATGNETKCITPAAHSSACAAAGLRLSSAAKLLMARLRLPASTSQCDFLLRNSSSACSP